MSGLALGLALHKDRAKALLRGGGIPTPDWTFLPEGSPVPAAAPVHPVIVKPAREDGSIGISFGSVASDLEGLREAVHRVWRMHQPALVERFVDGRELCVSFLGNAPRTALPLREISFGPSFADLSLSRMIPGYGVGLRVHQIRGDYWNAAPLVWLQVAHSPGEGARFMIGLGSGEP